jgi:hypothetical protein
MNPLLAQKNPFQGCGCNCLVFVVVMILTTGAAVAAVWR